MARKRRRSLRGREEACDLNCEEALNLRVQGYSYAEIGRELGISATVAHKRVGKALKRHLECSAEMVEEVRRVELDRLDRGVRKVMAAVEGGDLSAIPHLVRLTEARGRLTPGLEAPQQQQVTLPPLLLGVCSLSEDEVRLRLAELRGGALPGSGAAFAPALPGPEPGLPAHAQVVDAEVVDLSPAEPE